MNMTATRKMDALNRVVLPADMRAALGITPKTGITVEEVTPNVVALTADDTGLIVRHIDELGRILLSPQIREEMNLDEKAEVRLVCADGRILISAAVPVCRICGHELEGEAVQLHGYSVCAECVRALQKEAV